MSSDRARISYDEDRRYEAVVSLQGRAVVEADPNEASTIAREQLRRDALDFVGPAGTPDNGYGVDASVDNDDHLVLAVDPGTMYVGGMRVSLADRVEYADQSEWLERSDDPDWVQPSERPPGDMTNELVWLSLAEGDVGAVEDPALLEIALGGPDTSGRLRVTQRIKRLATDGLTCEDALVDAEEAWRRQGLVFDPDTMRLESQGRLLLSFTTDSGPDPCDPELPEGCEPEATGGYLGADNQLIRVQVTAWDAEKGVGRFAWGFDGASFLYRVDVADRLDLPNQTYRVVQLRSRPVDELHQPITGQAVEILRSAVWLDDTAYVAALSGTVMTLTKDYVPETMRIELPANLTAAQADLEQTPALFLRVWEREVEFQAGQPVVLTPLKGQTGLQVTLTTADGFPFHVGDHWLIAVRPATPTIVYPKRYLEAPQPPDGPRLWACPLAVIRWEKAGTDVWIADCRNPFDDLVELTRRKESGCCDVLIRPRDLERHSLQEIVDRFAGRAKVTICLMPGHYRLDRPLLLTAEHEGLTLEACHDGAVIEADPEAHDRFGAGLVVMDRADNVTFRGLRFHLPISRADWNTDETASHEVEGLNSVMKGVRLSIGIRPVHCAMLTVEGCLFRYGIGAPRLFGIGIFAQSECWGHRIERNRFLRDDEYLTEGGAGSRLLYGYFLSPSLLPDRKLVSALLEHAVFRANEFSGLAAAVVVLGDTGIVEVEGNDVHECYDGFFFAALRFFSSFHLFERQAAPPPATPEHVLFENAMRHAAMFDPVIVAGSVLATTFPLPPEVEPPHTERIDLRRTTTEERRTVEILGALGSSSRETVGAVTDSTGGIAGGARRRATSPAARTRVTSVRRAAGIAGAPPETVEAAVEAGPEAAISMRLAPVTAVPEIGMTLAEAKRYRAVGAKLSSVLVAAPTPSRLRLSIHASDNDVQTINADSKVRMASGLTGAAPVAAFVVGADPSNPSELTMVGNRFRGATHGVPTVTLAGAGHFAISGNVVLNESEGYCLMILTPTLIRANELTAVTGNVLRGQILLPARPGGLPAWEVFNARST
jgi:hypothetical protein